MIVISHRGNVNGPKPEEENAPDYISKALDMGFEAEIDVWVEGKEIILGHDKPTYPVDLIFILKHVEKLWVHCKNIEAMQFFNDFNFVNFFGHSYDDFVLTSQRYVFTKPGQKQTERSVLVMPERCGRLGVLSQVTYAVCTDYPLIYKNKILGESYYS